MHSHIVGLMSLFERAWSTLVQFHQKNEMSWLYSIVLVGPWTEVGIDLDIQLWIATEGQEFKTQSNHILSLRP